MSFFNAQGQKQTEFLSTSCQTQEIFVMGLKSGEKLISYDPFIIFYQNGQAIGLDNQFNQFYHLDIEGNVLSSIYIKWNANCNPMSETNTSTISILPNQENINTSDFPYYLIFIFLGLAYLVFLRKVLYDKDK